jgi:heat shock protein HspQ
MKFRTAKYAIGQVVKHRVHPFRGVIFDVDPIFSNTEEWYASIPEDVRPAKDQPFYHLLAENSEVEYIAYVSEQNLVPDTSRHPVRHPGNLQTGTRRSLSDKGGRTELGGSRNEAEAGPLGAANRQRPPFFCQMEAGRRRSDPQRACALRQTRRRPMA